MKSRPPPFYSVLAMFLCMALVVEPAVAQVKVYVEGYHPQYDLRNALPEWVQKAGSRGEADWIIDYEISKTSYRFPFSERIKNIGVCVVGGTIIVGPVIGLVPGIISGDLAGGLAAGVAIGFFVGLGVGIFTAIAPRTAYGKEGKEEYLKRVKKIIHVINIDFSNTLTGARRTLSTSSPKVTTDIERTLRAMAGDRTAPTLAVANLNARTRQTTQSPLINVEVRATDDVGLYGIGYEIGDYFYMTEPKGRKNHKETRSLPLDIGDNSLMIYVADLYGRKISKEFHIFRTRGPAVATSEERPPATVYPPLLSINEMSFRDESADGFLDAGEGGTLAFHIVNEGRGAAAGLRVRVESPQGSGIGVSPLESPPSVSPNSSVQVKYRLIGSATVPTQDVVMTISALDQPTQSPAPEVTYHVKTRGRWSDVDVDLPRARRSNPDGVAVIIGNRDYNDPGIYPVEFAKADAGAMKKYVLQALGYKEDNVIYLQNASYSDLRSIFGTESDPQGRLHNLIFPDRSDVFVYYSGHGVPGLEDRRGYLLPANVKAEDAQKNGYSLDLLGRNLAQLPAKSVTLVVDACFSGQSEEGLLIQDASPVYIEVTDPFVRISNGSSFFASMGKEIASWFPEQKHGLFTYYFLKGLRGEADANKDKRVTVAEIEQYLSETVPYKVRRLTGRSQHPVITATEKDRVLARY